MFTHPLFVKEVQSFFKKKTGTNIRKKTRLQRILFWVVLLVVGYTAVMILSVLQVYVHSTQAVQSLKQAKTEATTLRFNETQQSLQKAQDAFQEAKKYSLILSTAESFPFIGSSVQQSTQLISAGIDVVASLQSVSDIGKDVMQLSGLNEEYLTQIQEGTSPHISFSDLSPQTRQLVLARLEASSNKFSVLSQRIGLVQEELTTVLLKTSGGPLAPFIASVQSELTQTQTSLQQASLFTDIIPAFSGIQNPAHHLILFLNNTELRPSGGFVGNYGIATVHNGSIESVKTADVYALDRLTEGKEKEPTPYPIATYNQTPIWYLRDANWSPDFAVSAQKMIQKYSEERSYLSPEQRVNLPYADSVDGVFAFTPTFAARMLKLIGPVTVAGQTFTAENIADKLEYQVEYAYATQGIPEAQRKEIIGQLMDEVVKKMTTIPLSDWATVLSFMQDAFKNRQLFVYHTNPETEEVLTRAGWSGRYLPKTPDVQFVVDANLASLKTDPVVERTISYQISTDTNGQRVGKTSIMYHHIGSYDWKTSKYRTYTRVYVPSGSKLISVSGAMNASGDPGAPDVSSELGMTVFGAFVMIKPGETKTLTFQYQLADSVRSAIAKNAYALTVFKQNGANNHALTLDLDFGKNVVRAIPAEDPKEWGDAHYKVKTLLDQDKEFQIGL